MNLLNKNKTGLALGAFMGLCHAIWALLVLAGWAQPFIDWIFQLHFIAPVYIIGEFQLGTAVILIAVTSVIGYVVGWLLAAIWNWLHKS